MARPKKLEDEKTDDVALTIRFPRELKIKAKDLAAADHRSLNRYMVMALEEKVERDTLERDSDKKKTR